MDVFPTTTDVVLLGLVFTYIAVGDGSFVPSTNRTTFVVDDDVDDSVALLLPLLVRNILGNGCCCGCVEEGASSLLVSVDGGVDDSVGVSTIVTSTSLPKLPILIVSSQVETVDSVEDEQEKDDVWMDSEGCDRRSRYRRFPITA